MKPYCVLSVVFLVSLRLLSAAPHALLPVPSADAEPVLYAPKEGGTVMLESDVKKLEPNAVIVRVNEYQEKKGQYVIPASLGITAESIWIEKSGDWIEPITPPDKDDLPSIQLQQMKIVELKGKAQVIFPDKPDKTLRARNGMILPEGAVVQTDAKSTAAVFLGGVNSIRLGPGSEASLSQRLNENKRQTLIDLRSGFVFSKVGRRAGEIQDFRVRTPLGVAGAKGTDFVTVKLPDRMDVWIAEGTVQLDDAAGTKVGEVTAGPTATTLQIIRTPPITDALAAAQADSATMGAAIALIPQVNSKVNVLRERQKRGAKLSLEEVNYLGRIRRITWLVPAQKYDPAALEPATVP